VQVNVDAGLDESVAHRNLVIAGLAVTAFGAALSVWVYGNWEMMVAAVKTTGAAQAAVVAVGFVIIGLAVLYAGSPKRRQLQL
jgi:6,7-dimethyl-8-ribityllumazine synthase